MFETLVWNTKTTNVRRETLEGRPHIVVPTVMMVEGVLNGSNGPLMYKKDDIRRRYQSWDNRPVVVYHPSKNGKAATAADPVVLNTQKVGVVLNTRVELRQGKPVRLRSEAWIDEEKAKALMPEVLEKIRKGEPVEVSTGLYTENVTEEGEFGGKKYSAVATEFVPDHLAILPTGKGACSVQDGAGLNVNAAAGCCGKCGGKMTCPACSKKDMTANAMSHARTHETLQKVLDDRYGQYQSRVVDVYPGFVVYGRSSSGGEGRMKLYKHEYSTDKRRGEQDQVALKGDPLEVNRVTEYRTPDGAFVGNALYGTNLGESDMDKATMVSKIITNSDGDLDENDREWLMKKDEKWLKKILHEKVAAKEPEPVVNKAADTPAPKPPTFQELLNNADAATKELITEGIASLNAEREKLIAGITANNSNAFSKEQLAAMNMAMLRSMAKLAGVKDQPSVPAPLWAGAGGAIPPFVGNNAGVGGFTAPVLNEAPATKNQSK